MTEKPSVRLILADDHAIMRDGLRCLIHRQKHIEILGEAQTGTEALELSKSMKPNLMILDVGLPEINGIDVTQMILRNDPGIKIIGLSMHADRFLVGEMLKAGASGYVPKDCAFNELVTAIDHVMAGDIYLSPTITRGVIDSFVLNPNRDEINSVFSVLSERERQALQLLSEGRSTKEIADVLGISVRTAEAHRRNLMEKLDLHSVAELTKYAIRIGLTTVD